jgi:small-conductance mechanosensitive channel
MPKDIPQVGPPQWGRITPNRLLSALRWFVWVALPFIFVFVAVEKVFDGESHEALASLGAAVLSFVVAAYWYRIIPARFRDKANELEYLRTEQSFVWVALPFIFSLIAVERFFDGRRYQALAFMAMAMLTFVVAVCWDRAIQFGRGAK